MEGGTIQFIIFLLIIIVIKESLVEAVSLEATPTELAKSGDTITLTWKDMTTPSDLDWLGIYTPPESTDNHFIGYILLSSCKGWESGMGTYEFVALNMRAPYEFRLFKGYPPDAETPLDEDKNPLPSTKQRLAVSPTVRFHRPNQPTQLHLSLTSNMSEMRVMFVTKDPLRSFVQYGRNADNLHLSVGALSQTYQQSDMCAAPANSAIGWRDPGFIHTALLHELDSGARYFYKVGSIEGGWSETFSFIAPLEEAEETNAFLFGDLGTWVPYTTFNWVQLESVNTIKWLLRDLENLGSKPTFISHIGDISYARGYEWLWDAFFAQIEPVAARAPYHVCIGNHEYDWPEQPWKPEWAPYGTDGGGECGVPFSLRFHMPGDSSLATGTGSPATRNLYYSHDVGSVHFLYFSTETNFISGSDQYSFIAQDLKSVNRSKTPFIVFLGHRPMYSTDSNLMGAAFTKSLRSHIEPLLVENRVNLVLWGHVHKYERTCPIQNSSCMDSNTLDGALPIHIVIGMGGQDWQPIDQPRANHPTFPIFPQPSWSLFRSFEFGYIRLHATKQVMTVSYVGNHDGQVHDVVKIHSHFEHFKHIKLSEKYGIHIHKIWSALTSIYGFVTLCAVSASLVVAAAIVISIRLYSKRDSERSRGPWHILRTEEMT